HAGSWYVQLNGRQINLGPDRRAAHVMRQRLLGGVEGAPTSLTAHELLAHYSDWMKGNRAPSTVGPPVCHWARRFDRLKADGPRRYEDARDSIRASRDAETQRVVAKTHAKPLRRQGSYLQVA